MPEGHTIHRLAKDLATTFGEGAVAATSPQGRFAEGAALIDDATLDKAEAWGKHLFCWWSSGDILHVHLGLIGKFRPVPTAEAPTESVRLRLESSDIAWQLTGPQTCQVIDPVRRDAVVAPLGPDPLRRGRHSAAAFADRLLATSRPVGAALLDQSIIAGIGNVYRAELLFLTGLHPTTPANTVPRDLVGDLWELTRAQLKRGYAWNRIVTVSAPDVDRRVTRNLDPEDALYAYHRTGLPCRRCHDHIADQELAGRTIWYCPTCQPVPA